MYEGRGLRLLIRSSFSDEELSFGVNRCDESGPKEIGRLLWQRFKPNERASSENDDRSEV